MKALYRMKWSCLLLAAVPLLLATVSGCGRQSQAASTHSSSEPGPSTVTTTRPSRQMLKSTVEQPGQIEGFEHTALAVKIAGYLRKEYVDMGDPVRGPRWYRHGQVLAELWVPELEEELKQKEALAVQAEAEVELSKRVLVAAEATVEKAEANLKLAEAGRTRAEGSYTRWQAEIDRNRILVRRNALDQQTLDQTTDSFRSAEAARDESVATIRAAQAARLESMAQRDRAAADVKVSEARWAVARADRDRIAATVQYTKIRAPYDGVVTKRVVDSGAFMQPNGGTSVVFVVVRTDPVRIFVDVPEAVAVRVKEGMPAQVRVQAQDEQEFAGKVRRFSWALDPQQRTLRVQIDLPNPDGRLRPGMYATARLTTEHPRMLTVPASAVWSQDDQPMIVRIEDGKARRTPVKIGLRQGGLVQLLKKQTRTAPQGEVLTWDDFTGDERIVTANPATLLDGQEVKEASGGVTTPR
jgi:RND family efflux transporter MFP subunit